LGELVERLALRVDFGGFTLEDIDVCIERRGLNGLTVALEYADKYVDGTVTHRIAARELDPSPFESDIILQVLESVANAYADTAA
jgi:hypothetical protein